MIGLVDFGLDAVQPNEVSIADTSDEMTVDRLEKALDESVDSGVSVVEDSEIHDETWTERNAGEQQEDTLEFGSDFEENFNHFFNTNAASSLLKIEKEDHFVVVFDDEIQDVQSPQTHKVGPDYGDEWLLI